jgi:hypothetical protein
MLAQQPAEKKGEDDPRQSKVFVGKVLQHRASYAQERRIVLAHGTELTQMILACAIDHELKTDCPHFYKTSHTEDLGQVVFTIAGQPRRPIHLTKYMV